MEMFMSPKAQYILIYLRLVMTKHHGVLANTGVGHVHIRTLPGSAR